MIHSHCLSEGEDTSPPGGRDGAGDVGSVEDKVSDGGMKAEFESFDIVPHILSNLIISSETSPNNSSPNNSISDSFKNHQLSSA